MTVKLCFRVRTSPEQSHLPLCLAGNLVELSKWGDEVPIPLDYDDGAFSLTIDLPAATQIEYKYVFASDGRIAVWEGSPFLNREVMIEEDGSSFVVDDGEFGKNHRWSITRVESGGRIHADDEIEKEKIINACCHNDKFSESSSESDVSTRYLDSEKSMTDHDSRGSEPCDADSYSACGGVLENDTLCTIRSSFTENHETKYNAKHRTYEDESDCENFACFEERTLSQDYSSFSSELAVEVDGTPFLSTAAERENKEQDNKTMQVCSREDPPKEREILNRTQNDRLLGRLVGTILLSAAIKAMMNGQRMTWSDLCQLGCATGLFLFVAFSPFTARR